MKSYYQRKNTGYLLPPPIYKKTRNTIECYDFYRWIIDGVDGRKEEETAAIQNPEKRAVNKATAEYYVQAIDEALHDYVREDLRSGILDHVARRIEYEDLNLPYSTSTLKQWTQAFVYGAATILGDNFYGK